MKGFFANMSDGNCAKTKNLINRNYGKIYRTLLGVVVNFNWFDLLRLAKDFSIYDID
jgi:hypothetical protein